MKDAPTPKRDRARRAKRLQIAQSRGWESDDTFLDQDAEREQQRQKQMEANR
jgi:hypothetical protein